MSKIVRKPKARRSFAEVYLAKRAAWAAGKKVYVTVEIAATKPSGEAFTKHKRMLARDVWGDPRKYVAVIQSAAVRDD